MNSKSEVSVSKFDLLFGFCTKLSVGELGIFFVLDLSVGLSIAYRIEYADGQPLREIARLDSDGKPTTCVSDLSVLGATFCDRRLVLWDLASGITHRTLRFDSRVVATCFDAVFGCLFIALTDRMLYANVNGEVICELQVDLRVTVAACPALPLAHSKRCFFCGTDTGDIWLASPVFDSSKLVLRQLEKVHISPVRDIVLHPAKTGMVSTDTAAFACFWSCAGIKAARLKTACVAKCAMCHSKPAVCCGKCGHILCDQCGKGHSQRKCLGLEKES
jgi:hypothetical protein